MPRHKNSISIYMIYIHSIFAHGCNELYILTALLLNAHRSKEDTRVVDQAQVNFNSLEQRLA